VVGFHKISYNAFTIIHVVVAPKLQKQILKSTHCFPAKINGEKKLVRGFENACLLWACIHKVPYNAFMIINVVGVLYLKNAIERSWLLSQGTLPI
jgi:hypothetical protein